MSGVERQYTSPKRKRGKAFSLACASGLYQPDIFRLTDHQERPRLPRAQGQLFDLVFLGAAELVLAVLAPLFRRISLPLWCVLDAHAQFSRSCNRNEDQ